MTKARVITEQRFKTLVMNAGEENERTLFIMDEIDYFTKNVYGKSTCRPVEGDPSKMIIDTVTTIDRYALAKSVIEVYLPGLCVFNYEE